MDAGLTLSFHVAGIDQYGKGDDCRAVMKDKPYECNGAASDAGLILRWWLDAGVDTLVGDGTTGWLAAPEPVAEIPPLRKQMAPAHHPAPAPSFSDAMETAGIAYGSMESLEKFLAAVRTEVPGAPIADGAPDSRILIMGEGPSAEDLRTGRPFTGPAGKLLDRMLNAIGLDRTNCYISIAAPRRRIPGPVPGEDMQADLELTRAHIRLADPRLVLLMGGPPVQALTGDPAPIGRKRGKWTEIRAGDKAIPALPTFNPAYLLRRPDAKKEAWEDLLAFRRRMNP